MSTMRVERGPSTGGARALAAATAAILLILGITSPVFGEGETTGRLTGTIVSDTDGLPIAGASLCAFGPPEAGFPCGTVEEDGSFDFPALAPGSYRIEAWDPLDLHLAEYHEDSFGVSGWDRATLVEVVAGQTTTAHIGLFEFGQITGTVTADGGGPLGGIEVCAETSSNGDRDCTVSAADGTYAISDVGPLEQVISFEDPSGAYVFEYHADQLEWGDAARVALPSGSTLTVDAALAAGGSIAGMVTDEADSYSMDDIEVCAESDAEQFCTYTDDQGHYLLGGLPAGDYVIEFLGDWYHVDEYYDDALHPWGATVVTVSAGGLVSGVDAELARAGLVSGALFGPGASRDSEFYVELYEAGTNDDESTQVQGGSYTLDGVQPGIYRAAVVEIRDGYTVATTWYGGGSDAASAVYFSVGLSEHVTGIDFDIPATGSISGSVTTAFGTPAGGGTVSLIGESWSVAAEATIAAGGYGFDGVRPGRYLVVAQVPGHAGMVHTDSSGAPEIVEITAAGEVLTGIDIEPSGDTRIQGLVLDAGRQPYSGAFTVELWADSDVWMPTASASHPAGSGAFTLTVPAGQYRVRVVPADSTSRPTWNGGGADRWSSAPVHSDCCAAPVVSVQLLDSTRSLVVNFDDPHGPGVQVRVFAEGSLWLPTWSGAVWDDSVVIPNLPPGRYQVHISGLFGDLVGSKWYGDVAHRADSPLIDLTGPGGSVEIDTTRPPYVSAIGGQVVGGGRAAAGATVLLYDDSARFAADHQATVGADGNFEIRDIAPGNYRLLVKPSDPSLGSLWYGDTNLRSQAQVIRVADEWDSHTELFVLLPTL